MFISFKFIDNSDKLGMLASVSIHKVSKVSSSPLAEMSPCNKGYGLPEIMLLDSGTGLNAKVGKRAILAFKSKLHRKLVQKPCVIGSVLRRLPARSKHFVTAVKILFPILGYFSQGI